MVVQCSQKDTCNNNETRNNRQSFVYLNSSYLWRILQDLILEMNYLNISTNTLE